MNVRVLAAAVACLALASASPAMANNYSDPEYAQHDLDNYMRARGQQIAQAESSSYTPAFIEAATDSQSRAASKQANDIRYGRVYGGLSHYVPTYGATGDPEVYVKVNPTRVHFLSRTGAKLQGHIWGAGKPGSRPGVVITPGSIQGTDQMYWWAANVLAGAGYVVMTFDAQGQGQSETFGHDPGSLFPTPDGVPFQQEDNFVDGTVDALRFFVSTPAHPYRPTGWSEQEAKTAKAAAAGEHMNWTNPGHASLDRTRLGIAGHSLGARAVSVVQQCSSSGTAWKTTEACHNQSFPIKAVVGWDTLSEDVTPVVPGLDLRADGYFLSPTFAPTAPDAQESLPAFDAWRKKGFDTQVIVIRGGTHLDFSHVPYHGPATRYGPALAAHYTLGWMDRYVSGDADTRKDGYAALTTGGPKDKAQRPWSANHMSVRRLSAMSLTRPGAVTPSAEAVDLRKWAGRSKVGDWAGANADTVGSELP